jgi:membrane associated rhomboid family serine protease
MTFSQLIKEKWLFGGVAIRIIAINILFFLIINLFVNIDNAFMMRDGHGLNSWVENIFMLHNDFKLILTKPWSLLTHMFSHQGFLHLLFNMIWFYFGAQIFKNFLGDKRLVYVYLFGGLFGAFTQVLAANFIPFFQESAAVPMLGASAAVSSVFIAVAFYKPTFEVMLFGLFPVRLIYIALLLMLSDFLRVTDYTSVAHMAHLGGAVFGILVISKLILFDRFVNQMDRFFWIFSGGFSKMRSRIFLRKQTPPAAQHFHKADEKYFESKKEIQEKIDAILDKIKAKGYDALTKNEKDYLFTHKDRL